MVEGPFEMVRAFSSLRASILDHAAQLDGIAEGLARELDRSAADSQWGAMFVRRGAGAQQLV
jgi:hypothetical protein